MSALCLATGKLLLAIPIASFTLAWTHSIEKVRWEEDWEISGKHLLIREARIRGSGAGMEAPPGARLQAGVWHYQPASPPMASVALSHSPYTAGYELCTPHCQLLADLLPGIEPTALIQLSVCTPEQTQSRLDR
ncbi:MAG: DUF1850 domain-containing protein [Zoogloeaceae bacterium]|nr:DUF1850 domain-containing protein [Zoogloeaceae bacterium]